MHRFKFSPDDLFINRLKTYPEYNVSIYQGEMFVNRDIDEGGLKVYDINSNRTGTDKVYPFVLSGSEQPIFKSQVYQPLLKNFSSDRYFTGLYRQRLAANEKIASYGDGTVTFGGMTAYTSSYGSESPIKRNLTLRSSAAIVNLYNINTGQFVIGTAQPYLTPINVTASALQNVARKYTTLSDHFIFSSSSIRSRDLVKDDTTINFVTIPSMYYGSSIKKGSVELNFYITGSKIASCADTNHNGVLIGTTGSTLGQVVGLVMYDKGIIMLTSSANLEEAGTPALNIKYNGDANPVQLSSWQYYGTTLDDGIDPTSTGLANTSFDLNFKGTSYVNSMTMFAHARKGHLNHSNNPTYRDLTFTRSYTTGSGRIYLEGESPIANVVSASYVSASFDKTTYISKVHIYDEDGNLIAITSMAKPIKKTLNDEFTFKMKLDL